MRSKAVERSGSEHCVVYLLVKVLVTALTILRWLCAHHAIGLRIVRCPQHATIYVSQDFFGCTVNSLVVDLRYLNIASSVDGFMSRSKPLTSMLFFPLYYFLLDDSLPRWFLWYKYLLFLMASIAFFLCETKLRRTFVYLFVCWIFLSLSTIAEYQQK